MIWWIIIGTIIVLLFVLFFLFIKGSDLRGRSGWVRNVEGEEQEKAIAEMMRKKN